MLKSLHLLAASHGLSRGGLCSGLTVGLSRAVRRQCRGLADTRKPDSTTKKVVATQGTDSMAGVRIRRARPSDVPRALRFVREHARPAWPHAPSPAPRNAVSLVIADYVARALAQGHSLVAEKADGRRGWLTVRGVALAACVCEWDARLTDQCARCVRCPRARRTLHFAAHCLRAPKLHDKYHVHRILQVVLMVPPQQQQDWPALARPLLRAAVQRAADSGIPLLRVDVTDGHIAKILEELQFKKEWYMEYEVVPEAIAEGAVGGSGEETSSDGDRRKHFVAVYTTSTTRKPLEVTQPAKT